MAGEQYMRQMDLRMVKEDTLLKVLTGGSKLAQVPQGKP
jgi:hypothetical protein